MIDTETEAVITRLELEASRRNLRASVVKPLMRRAARLLRGPPPRSDADEIARPRCMCPSETVRRVIVDHGTCTMGGCPYGGDI